MSNIFVQKDNITILGDIYDYPINKFEGEKLIETITQKAVLIQIVIIVNGKQKLFTVNYDLEAFKAIGEEGGPCAVCNDLHLKNYESWNNLKDFLITIGYDLEDFNITNAIELSYEED